MDFWGFPAERHKPNLDTGGRGFPCPDLKHVQRSAHIPSNIWADSLVTTQPINCHPTGSHIVSPIVWADRHARTWQSHRTCSCSANPSPLGRKHSSVSASSLPFYTTQVRSQPHRFLFSGYHGWFWQQFQWRIHQQRGGAHRQGCLAGVGF